MKSRRLEPETLSGIVAASLLERNRERKHAYEEKLRDVNEELLLKKLAEFICTEQGRLNGSFLKSLGLYLSFIAALVVLGLIGILRKWEMSGFFFVVLLMPGSLSELWSFRRKAAISQAIKKFTQLTQRLKSGACVGPLLDVISCGSEEALGADLLECLRVPLYRIDPELAAHLTASQLRTLEDLVIKEADSELTILGLLALGTAGYRVVEWETICSWAKAPERRGRAAREYMATLGGVVR
ncbi:MAG: hypothetical protein QM758_26340 [Armatimonas sp.]